MYIVHYIIALNTIGRVIKMCGQLSGVIVRVLGVRGGGKAHCSSLLRLFGVQL